MITKDDVVRRAVERLKQGYINPAQCPVCGNRTYVDGTQNGDCLIRYRFCRECGWNRRTLEVILEAKAPA